MTHTLVSVIGGRPAEAAPAATISSPNPSRTSDVVAEVALADAATFAAACAAAKRAQPSWADVPAPVRGRVAGAIGRIVEANKDSLARLVTRELGKPYPEALGEVQEIIDTCDFFLGEGRRRGGPDGREFPGRRAVLVSHPGAGGGQYGGLEAGRIRRSLSHGAVRPDPGRGLARRLAQHRFRRGPGRIRRP